MVLLTVFLHIINSHQSHTLRRTVHLIISDYFTPISMCLVIFRVCNPLYHLRHSCYFYLTDQPCDLNLKLSIVLVYSKFLFKCKLANKPHKKVLHANNVLNFKLELENTLDK